MDPDDVMESPGWFLRSWFVLAQIVLGALLLYGGVAVSGIADHLGPPLVLAICAVIVAPAVLLRQVAHMLEDRLAQLKEDNRDVFR